MANTLEIILRARDEASAQLKAAASNMSGLTGALKQNQQALTMIAVGGGAAAAGLGFLAKAAADEETSVIRLSVALRNVGVSYDAVKGSLEGAITATQRKTGIADDQQRAALQRLLIGTSDYAEALRRLPIALDLAAATGMDAAQAGQLLGRITDETSSILVRYGITLKEGATATEALAAIQQKVGGTAEEMGNSAAGAMNKMRAAATDAMESFGTLLLPAVTKAAAALQALAESLQRIPEWLKVVGMVLMGAAAAGGLVAGLGLLVIQAQKGIAAMLGLAKALGIMQAMTGPKGWATLAISTALVIAIDQMDVFKAKGVDAFESVSAAGVRAARDIAQAWENVHQQVFDPKARKGPYGITFPSDESIMAVLKKNAVATGPVGMTAEEQATWVKEMRQREEAKLQDEIDLAIANAEGANALRDRQFAAIEAQRKAAEDAWNAMDKEVVTIFDPIAGEWKTVMKAEMDAQQALANQQSALFDFQMLVEKAKEDRLKKLATLEEEQIKLEKALAEERHKLWLQKEGFYAGALSAYIQAGGQAQLLAVPGTPVPVDDPVRRADINRRMAEEYARTGTTPVNVTVTVRDETGRALSLLGTEVNTAARVRSE